MVNGQYEIIDKHHFFYLKAPQNSIYVHPNLSNTTLALTKLTETEYEIYNGPMVLSFPPQVTIAASTVLDHDILSENFEVDIVSDVSFRDDRFQFKHISLFISSINLIIKQDSFKSLIISSRWLIWKIFVLNLAKNLDES